MTLSDYKTVIEVIAFLIAGGWAVYGFIILRQREKASIELRKLDFEARKAELELQRNAVIHADISATSTASHVTHGYYLLAEVTLINEGKRGTRLKWKGEAPAFAVRRVVFDKNGAPTFPDEPVQLRVTKTRDPNSEAVSHIIRAGAVERLPFAVHLSQPGVYLLSFRAVVSPEELPASVEAGIKANSTVAWTVAKYIVIQDAYPNS